MSRWARESLSYGLSRRLIRVDAVDYHHLWHQDYRPVATSGLPRDLLQRDRRSGRDYDEFMTTPEIDSLQSASLFNDARFAHPLLRDSVGGGAEAEVNDGDATNGRLFSHDPISPFRKSRQAPLPTSRAISFRAPSTSYTKLNRRNQHFSILVICSGFLVKELIRFPPMGISR